MKISLCVNVSDGISLTFIFFDNFKSQIIPTLKPGMMWSKCYLQCYNLESQFLNLYSLNLM